MGRRSSRPTTFTSALSVDQHTFVDVQRRCLLFYSGRLASATTVSHQQTQATADVTEANFSPSVHNSLKLFSLADFYLTLNYFNSRANNAGTTEPNLTLSQQVSNWTGWLNRPTTGMVLMWSNRDKHARSRVRIGNCLCTPNVTYTYW